MKTRRIYSILALVLALVMCFSVFTACDLGEDDDRDSSSNKKTSSSSVKTYVYNYSDVSELENYDSPAELESKNWKSASSFDLSKQWVFNGNVTSGGSYYGANIIKVENTGSSPMKVDFYFKVSGDLGEVGDKINFYISSFDENGDPIYSRNDIGAFISLSAHTSKASPFTSIIIPANETRFVSLMQTYSDLHLNYGDGYTEVAVEFNAKVTLGVSATKASSYTEEETQTNPPYGGYETGYETDYNSEVPGDLSYYDMYTDAYVNYYYSYANAYDEYGNYLFNIYSGEYVTLIGISSDYTWAKVEYNGKVVYVELDRLEESYDTEVETEYETEMLPADYDFMACDLYAIAHYGADLYDEYLNYQGFIYDGTYVTVDLVSTDYMWCRILHNSKYYFVYRSELEFIDTEGSTTDEGWYEESETYDVSRPEYCEFEGRDEYVNVSSYYDSVPLFDSELNPIIYVNGGTELYRYGVSTDPDGTWSAVEYNGEHFYIYSYMLDH